MTWTDDRVALLKKLWASGLSASQVAKRLGHDVSRNAVIGKVRRLGVSERAKSPRQAYAENSKAQGKKQSAAFAAQARQAAAQSNPARSAFDFRTQPKPAPHSKRLPASMPPAPEPEAVAIAALTGAICHWPLERNAQGDDEQLYCGVDRDPRSTRYCLHHQLRMLDEPGRKQFLSRRA